MNEQSTSFHRSHCFHGGLTRTARDAAFVISSCAVMLLAGLSPRCVDAAGPTGPMSLSDGFRDHGRLFQHRQAKPDRAQAAESAVVRIVKRPLDRTGRYFGAGFGDGYHGCHGSGFRPGADLPPISSHASRRNLRSFQSSVGATYYDQFDRQPWVQAGGYEGIPVHAESWQSITPAVPISPAEHRSSADEEASDDDANPESSEPMAREETIDGWDDLLTSSLSTGPSGTGNNAMAATVNRLANANGASVSRLPLVNPSVSRAKPARLPAANPSPNRGRTAEYPRSTKPARVAEIPDWLKESADSIQFNPYVR